MAVIREIFKDKSRKNIYHLIPEYQREQIICKYVCVNA